MPPKSADAADFLKDGGQTGALIRTYDWASTSLGPIEAWPQSLKTATSILLRSPVPMVMLWGADGIMLYNDAYSVFAGGRHPQLLGSKVREGWPEVADFNDHIMKVGLAGGTLHYKDQELTLYRHGRPEQVWMDLDYSPVLDESGGPAGVLAIVAETTERVVAERKIKESSERFRAFVTASSSSLYRMSPDWTEMRQLDGRGFLSDTEAPSPDWLEIYIHPDDQQHMMAAIQEAIATRSTFELEHRVRLTDGSLGWTHSRAVPIFDERGEIVEWFGAASDVTARKQAEERLLELNETLERRVAEALAERKLLADIIEGTDAFVQVADTNFRWLAINKAAADEFERIFGVRPRVGESMLDLLAHMPEHQAAVRAVWSRALAGEAFTEVDEFGDPGRERRCYEMKYNVLRGADGALIGAYQFVYDVTQRISEQRRLAEAEAARREADALYRAYFENTPEALFVIGVEPAGGFLVEQINPAHEAGVGFRLEEIRGKRIEEILPPDMAERVLATYRHVVETGAICQYREVFDLTGEPQHWDTSLVPVQDADGRITRLIGSSRNVTRQVLAEEALRQSQKMEAMGQLTGGVAHDFNNLLTPIVGALDMLQRKSLGGEREQRLIAGAMQSAERAKTLVQRLLAFARRQPLQPIPVDIANLVTGMGDLVSSTTGPQIKVVVETADDLPPAMADPNQLEMALLNLAVNARDAMPESGTLRITASAERVRGGQGSKLKPGAYIRLSVADTGSGMDEATLARAVEPFFSTKGVGQGTGLGLSMVHGLASQLGGALTIRSRPGLGTNVELWLPQSSAAAVAVEPAPESPSATARGTALLVDDEELVRLSTADMLGDLGYAVIEAASAEEAMRLVHKGQRFDLLVTDHLMPGMNGTDLARVIRSARPDLPVLVVSGYAESEGIEADLPRLTKPFRKDELASSLAQICAVN